MSEQLLECVGIRSADAGAHLIDLLDFLSYCVMRKSAKSEQPSVLPSTANTPTRSATLLSNIGTSAHTTL